MIRTLLAWAPLLGLGLLQLIPKEYWCTSIEPGGREFVCGYEYAHAGVKAAVNIYLVLAALAFIGTVWLAYQRRLSKSGIAGLVVTSLLFAIFAWAKLSFGNEGSP